MMGKLPLSLKSAWGLGSVGTVTVLTVNSLLLLFFMTTVLGIAPALAGGLLFAAKLFDAVAAPVLGGISDNWKGRWGRRAPFLLAGALCSGLGIVLIFNPPVALAGNGLSVWVLGSLVVIALGYTLFNVPYLAMPAEMTDDRLERTSIMSWRIGFVSAGGLLVGLMPQAAASLGGGRQGYGMVGIILGVAVVLTMGSSFWASLRTRRMDNTGKGEIGFKRYLVVLQNKPFMMIIIAKIFQLIGIASLTASVLFLFKSVLGAPDSAPAFYVAGSSAATVLTMPLWVKLGQRFSKQALYGAACLGWAAITLTWLLASRGEPMTLIVARGIAGGVFTGGLLLMGQSLLPDAIDEDCRKSGVRREGVYAGAYSFIEKLASATGPLIVGSLLQVFHFQPKLPRGMDQPADAITGIFFGAAVLPPLLFALSVIPLLFFKLEPVPPAEPAAAE
ncbi:MAG: MFS transporter [Polymorphobacter sp.]|uniref:MFS transporter n=1 Tax=Polymorphobacter sp. TaxID=1909290 RepID=UPI003A83969A